MTMPLSEVKINDFAVGQVLPGDIVDEQDKVLFRKGLKLTKDILAAWERRGAGPFFLKGSATKDDPAPPQRTESHEKHEYDPDFLKQVNDWFHDLLRAYETFAAQVATHSAASMNLLESGIDRLLELVEQDPTGIVYWFADSDKAGLRSTGLTSRSVQLTALAAALSKRYGLAHEDCWRTSQAALLHDLALIPEILQGLQDSVETEEERQDVIIRHGFYSADLVNARASLPELVRVVMQQVHEQMDASGCPRGIPGHVINVMARLINVVDAFLTLITATASEPGIIPADAIAYLVYHTSRGAFDREAMLAFINLQSMYGIASDVLLDDGRPAMVLRPSQNNALRPIVAVTDPAPGSQPKSMDLSKTDLNIERPIVESANTRQVRLAKAKMPLVFWQNHKASDAPEAAVV